MRPSAGSTQAEQHARSGGIDTWLSSTTPDVAARPVLRAPTWVSAGSLVGLTVGALIGRSRAGAGIGAAVGAGVGVALLGADRIGGGKLSRIVQQVGLDRRHQIWFVISHPTKPWIASMGLGIARDARAAQLERFGSHEPLDGPQDAFRHAYAAALFSLRAMRDHGQDPATAHALALGAGEAHERDGQDSNDAFSREMDFHNNEAGTRIVGDGRARLGEHASGDGFVTEQALQLRVLEAMSAGELQLVDRSGTTPTARPSTPADLPAPRG